MSYASAMDRVLAQLRAAAEPTRLRLLALCARGAFCVSDLCEVLGQSQPRLSRHLKLLVEAGLLERVPEGANAYFGLPPDAELARADPGAAAGGRPAARRRPPPGGAPGGGAGAGSLGRLPPPRRRLGRECAPSACPPPRSSAALLDAAAAAHRRASSTSAPAPGGCWNWWRRGPSGPSAWTPAATCWRWPGRGSPSAAWPTAAPCARPTCTACRCPTARFDVVALQMVLHYAEDPAAALAEAARVLRPDGLLVVADLAPHEPRGAAGAARASLARLRRCRARRLARRGGLRAAAADRRVQGRCRSGSGRRGECPGASPPPPP